MFMLVPVTAFARAESIKPIGTAEGTATELCFEIRGRSQDF